MSHNQNGKPGKRHCMVVHAYYPTGETRVEREALALIKYGYEVDVICLWARKSPQTETRDGVNIYRLPVKRNKSKGVKAQLLEYLTFFVLALVKLTQLHWQRRYGVVQVHNLPDFLVFVGLIPKLMGTKLILDLHDLMPEFYAARFKDHNESSWLMRLVRWQEQLSCCFADHVITVTELWRQTLIKRGVPAQKVSVVMNVADERIFKRGENIAPRSVNGDQFRLIYHGNITYRYGLDLLVQAVDRVRETIPHIRLDIIGGGEFVPELRQMVQELGLSEYVHINNPVPADQLPSLIVAADLGVVPYRNDVFTRELLPTKLLEYVVMGLPCIAAHTQVITTYFDDTMVEYFTPENVDELAASIIKLYHDPLYRVTLVKNADGFNQRYNWTKLGAEYVKIVDVLGV